jgi:endoplasmic reticulum-Golgi intermediate compartment protein 2
MQVNLDITIAMPCSALTVNAVDVSKDRLIVDELLKLEGANLDLSGRKLNSKNVEYDTFHGVLKRARRSRHQRRKPVPNGPACRIYGSFPVNKVQGNLYITGKTAMYGMRGSDHDNFTHQIDELSFGEYFPKLLNPLDGVISVAEKSQLTYQYFLSIVPTTYKSSSTGRVVETNQYAVTEQVGTPGGTLGYPSGLVFKYDIEPVSLTISDHRMPFTQFLVRTINIIGGIVVCTNWLFKLFEATIAKTWRSRDAHGYLDKPRQEDD